jgi:uncharacterized protein YcbK (DUF882 family)
MKKILNFSDFVLNEIKIQNPEEAINVISKQIDKNEKDKVIREISSEYFSEELLDGSKILKLNDRNQDISVIQSILIALGYLKNKYADGVLDLQTIESIQLIIKDFNLPIIVSDSIPFSFIKFVLEFESKEVESEDDKISTMKPPKIPSYLAPTAALSIQLPQPSVTRGENIERGKNFPSEKLEKYAVKSIQYSLSKDGDKQLSPNFKVSEFACRDGSDVILINPHLVEILERVRNHFGKNVRINSGYRTPSYNSGLRSKSKNVAKTSQHLFGNAADITISGVSPKEIYNFINPNHQGGLGLYSNFVHVDVRDTVGLNRSRW